jgi:hypothetical protein
MLTQSQIAIAFDLSLRSFPVLLTLLILFNRAKAIVATIESKGLQLNEVCCHRMTSALLRKGREQDALYAIDYFISGSLSNLGLGTSSHDSNSSTSSSSSRSSGSTGDSSEQSISSSSTASNNSKCSDTDISNSSSNGDSSGDGSSSGGTSVSDLCSACVLAAAAVSPLSTIPQQAVSVFTRL